MHLGIGDCLRPERKRVPISVGSSGADWMCCWIPVPATTSGRVEVADRTLNEQLLFFFLSQCSGNKLSIRKTVS